MNSTKKRLLYIPEAMKMARVSPRTMMRWLSTGLLPATHPGRGKGPGKGRPRVRIKRVDLQRVMLAKSICWPGRVIGSKTRKRDRKARKLAALTPKQVARAARKKLKARRLKRAASKK